MTVRPISPGSAVRPTHADERLLAARGRGSRPCRSRSTPARARLDVGEREAERRAASPGPARTWTCRTPPPIAMTFETPGIVEQARAERPLGEVAERERVHGRRVGGPVEPDEHDLAHHRRDRPHRRRDAVGAARPSGGARRRAAARGRCRCPTRTRRRRCTARCPLTLRTRSTPGAPFIACSRGSDTSVSTSSGASPSASVSSVTVGRFRSGSTSTGRPTSTYVAVDEHERRAPPRRAGGCDREGDDPVEHGLSRGPEAVRALDDDALAGRQARQHRDAGGRRRPEPDPAAHERFGSGWTNTAGAPLSSRTMALSGTTMSWARRAQRARRWSPSGRT